MAERVSDPAVSSDGPWWTKPSIAAYALTIYGCAIAGSFFLTDTTLKNLMLGSAIGLATTVMNFYFGSSSGSQKKDDTIAAQGASLAVSTPAVAPVTTTTTATAAGETTTVTAPAEPPKPPLLNVPPIT
jgi:hypothetical protein